MEIENYRGHVDFKVYAMRLQTEINRYRKKSETDYYFRCFNFSRLLLTKAMILPSKLKDKLF